MDNRDHLRYPSDLTDREWEEIEPMIPPAKHGGRHRSVDVREVMNGIMYVLSTGCQWRYAPKKGGANRQTLRPRQRLRNLASPMGRGADYCVA